MSLGRKVALMAALWLVAVYWVTASSLAQGTNDKIETPPVVADQDQVPTPPGVPPADQVPNIPAPPGTTQTEAPQGAPRHQSQEHHVVAKLIANVKSVRAGRSFKVGALLKMDPGWHTYYKESGDAGMPTKIEWSLPAGYKASDILWEKPHKFSDSGITTYGYADQVLVAAEITPPETISASKLDISAEVKWLSCKDICIPGKATIALSLPVTDKNAAEEPDNAELFKNVGWNGSVSEISTEDHEAAAVGSSTTGGGGGGFSLLDARFNQVQGEQSESLLTALGLAFVGGFILNFMPCVLPVIAIKVMSFMQQAQEEPKRVRMLGFIFTAGIISSFMLLAGLVIAIQAAGKNVGWGFLFQYPGFVLLMAAIILLLALSLFGLFYVDVSSSQGALDKLASKEGNVGTFFKGVLATTLSTPCTAPFLGTALGFAFTQPWWVVAMIFFTIGLGMSSPYLVLTAKPDWMKYVPKPGVWMEKFKESMGFILMGTVIWLLNILAAQVGANGVMWATFFLLCVAIAAWIVSRYTDLTSTSAAKARAWGAAAAVVLIGGYVCIVKQPTLMIALNPLDDKKASAHLTQPQEADAINWVPFTVRALEKEVTSGKTVLVDFTAEWCVTCKVNEQTALHNQAVLDKVKALNVVMMKADWTTQDPDITKVLQKFNRSGVPLVVIFPAGKPNDALQLPDGLIGPDDVLTRLDKAGPSKI